MDTHITGEIRLNITRAHYEILENMLSGKLQGMAYKNIKTVENIVDFVDLQKEYRIKKKFKQYIRPLVAQGLIDDHGKSMDVLSLSNTGMAFVRTLLNYEKEGRLNTVVFKDDKKEGV